MRVAKRLSQILPSVTLEITATAKRKAKEGKRIINFAAGEPDFPTPQHIKKAAQQAIEADFTRYTPSSGIIELKEAICRKFQLENSLSYNTSQILVSCGAKHSLFNAILAIVNPGDEVLIPVPYWVSYPEMVKIAGGHLRFIETSRENNFKMTKKDLKKALTKKTKVLILNSPCNPSGSVYSKEELQDLTEVILDGNIYCISDEIYEKIIYEQEEFYSIASLGEEIKALTIVINGVSKTYSMTGWRIGYLAAPQEIVKAIASLQSHSTSNPCSISQKAALAAIESDQTFIKDIVKEFTRRRNYLVDALNKTTLKALKPAGTFYAFCDISKTNLDSVTFCKRLLEEMGVAVIPGKAFGMDSFVRISFACNFEDIKEGIRKIENWLSK
jgi:aspartate aminotransferase